MLLIVLVIGLMTMRHLEKLGAAIDTILRENYRSVVAAQDMKESLERIDSGILFHFVGLERDGQRFIEDHTAIFREALKAELGNVTLPGEGEKARQIETLSTTFIEAIPSVTAPSIPVETRRHAYVETMLPLFQEIKDTAQAVLEMNQGNMLEASATARRLAADAHRQMLLAIFASALIAVVFVIFSHRWILLPLHLLTQSANDIRNGNLDLVIEVRSHDEIGQLSESFNAMTEALREVRRTEKRNLMRSRRATEEVFKVLPTAIALLDLEGRVETATETAERIFGFKPGLHAADLGFPWLQPLVQRALAESRMVESEEHGGIVQQFANNSEYFFHPAVVPIPVGVGAGEPTGTAVIMRDVTQVHEQRELKRGVVSTLSHQLKTPLTSIRMSLHLLLRESIGSINDKQTELLVAAREDSDRLVAIIDDLLDINRIESGHAMMDAKAVAPDTIARNTVDAHDTEARDRGIALSNDVPHDLPRVMVDEIRIAHVFGNLLSNAMRFTPAGGRIAIRAAAVDTMVRFAVEDSGPGIPVEYREKVFDQFFRVRGQEAQSGAGLGLAIVREIVLAHGGSVGIDDAQGGGASIWFTLPQANR